METIDTGATIGAMLKSTRTWMIFAVGLVVATMIGGMFLINWWLDVSFFKAAGFIQSVATVLAIGVGGVFAFYKLEIFREFQPHLTVSQEVAHRKLGDSYIHVSVTATLSNNSRVAIEIRQAEFRLQQISPFNDGEIDSLHMEFLASPNTEKYIPFPSVLEYCREWEPNELTIEPGEVESEVYDFIVRDVFDTVSVDSFFIDTANSADTNKPKGWSATSVHDIR